jgi:hypothetical protein
VIGAALLAAHEQALASGNTHTETANEGVL